MDCSATSLTQPRPTQPEVFHSGLGPPRSTGNHENVPIDMPTSQLDGGGYSIEIPSKWYSRFMLS